MAFDNFTPENGVVLLGCGKMGMALLQGWLRAGLNGRAVEVIDPTPTQTLLDMARQHGFAVADESSRTTAKVVVIAVKPQQLASAVPSVTHLATPETVILSVVAGTFMAWFEQKFAATTPVIRAMPNTPAAIGAGISALICNAAASTAHLALAESMMAAVGKTVLLENEAQMDAVTGVSGSGPAYVFHMVEALTAAGEREGLPTHLAAQLARATVAGAGGLLAQTNETAAQLRANVTSPNGTTFAGLQPLMDTESGLTQLMTKTVSAAANRSRELRG